MIIDAHQHFWSVARNDYGWLSPDLTELYRDHSPGHLLPLLSENGIDGTILVQAAPTEQETQYLLDIAKSTPFIKGVIGWLPMDSEQFETKLAAMQAAGVKGIRPMLQDIADPNWILKPELDASFNQLIQSGLVFEGLIRPPQWLPLLRRLTKHPELNVVIDHGAKPDIQNGYFEPWCKYIKLLAKETPVMCKLSGLWGEAGKTISSADMRPWFDTLFENFGPERIIWGSDWPVLNLVGDYPSWLKQCKAYCNQLTDRERQKVFSGNANCIYKL